MIKKFIRLIFVLAVSQMSIVLGDSEREKTDEEMEMDRANTKIGLEYEHLMNALDENQKADLRGSQRDWIKWRDSESKFKASLNTVGGASSREDYYKRQIDLINQRSTDLGEYMKGMEIVESPTKVDQNEKESKNQPTEAGKTLQNQQGIPPLIKGIGIGMNFLQLEEWFKEKFKDTTVGYEIFNEESKVFMIASADKLSHFQEGGKNSSAELRREQLRLIPNGHSEVPSIIMADAAGLVHLIVLQPNLVNYLFKANNVGYVDFKNLFLESYKLNSMPITESFDSFSVTTEAGVNFTVSSDKTIVIKKVERPDKVKSSFD